MRILINFKLVKSRIPDQIILTTKIACAEYIIYKQVEGSNEGRKRKKVLINPEKGKKNSGQKKQTEFLFKQTV